jgi:hypothetical protein
LTINSTYNLNQTLPAGEGRLYQVVPVTKYGGEIKYNETISGTNSLLNTMNIEPGATLTINGTYNIYANINVYPGGHIVINPGAILKFYNYSSLIVDGVLTANGNSSQRITFTSGSGNSPNSWNCIKVEGSNATGSTIKYANIQYGNEVQIING